MEANVTEKSTKSEILKAYESLLKKVQEEKSNVPKQMQEEKQKKGILEKVSGISSESIVRNIDELKNTLNNSLDELHRNLIDEFKKLEEIRSAIAVEKQSLEDMYSLTANTDSLAAMLLAQKEKKESFEKDITDLKAQWEQEKVSQKVAEKEYLEELSKRRKREEDEYLYKLKISRQKDSDEYETQKTTLEKELKEKKLIFEQETTIRERELKSAENELAELRKNNVEFPGKIEKVIKDKELEVTKSMEAKYEYELKFIDKQHESEIRLKDQMISSLQEKIKELQIQVKEYGDKANRAEDGVKDIAVKAIESASKIKVLEKPESMKE